MSQNTEKAPAESEDLFTTQDLLESQENSKETAKENPQNVIESLDLDFGNSEEIDAADVEKEAAMDEIVDETEETDDIIEDDIPDDEITEDPEAENEDITETEIEGESSETPEGSEVVEGEATKKKAPAKSNVQKITELPLSKVKHIIKLDPDVNLVNADAVYLITKATEYFIRTLAKESFSHAAQQKKKTITKSHVDQALAMLPIEMM